MVDAWAHSQLGHHDVALPALASNPEERGQAPPGKYVVLDAEWVTCR
jgi:hypothetical protein